MKKLILLCSIIFIGALELNSQTTIPGGQVYGTWTLAGSPYNVTGSVMVPADSTLIIEPGVTVTFQGMYKMLVSGRLLAVGTAADTIFFTAADTANGWRGIDFDNTPSSQDTSKIIYCSVQHGKASGTSSDVSGGAVYINNFSKVIVSHNSISNNKANSVGGGIYCYLSNAIISNNKITNNTSSANGGGIVVSGACSPKITYNIISFNSSSSNHGGGISATGNNCTPLIDHNSITYNTASQWGGGIIVSMLYCDAIITNNDISHNTASAGGGITCYSNIGNACIISGNTISYNTAGSLGGGIWCYQSGSPTISYNIISNNNLTSTNTTPTLGGGGLAATPAGSNPKISNTIFANNNAANGGAIFCNYGLPSLVNCDIVNNSSIYGGALYCYNNVDVVFRNTIIRGNTASTSGAQLFLNDDASDPNFYYCDVEGGSGGFDANGGFYTGTYSNTISTDPLFVSPSGGSGTGFNGVTADWSLQNTSPCIDAGDPSYSSYPATDLANNPRVTVCRVDIGAYEYQNAPPLLANPLHTDATCYNGCNGTAVVNPTGGSGSYTYLWTPGNYTTPSITGLCNGTYTVQVNESGGCSTSVSVVITQPSSSSTSTVSICMATVDSASVYNEIYWDKTTVPLADTFLIYRDTANNNYVLIGKVPADSLSMFIDTVRTLYPANGDPNVSSWRYKIAVKDTCGNIGSKSPYHQTMFIQNNSGNFSWNQYQIEGQTIPVPAMSSYKFERDDSSHGVWNTVQVLSASSTAYTDPNYFQFAATGNWRVETNWTIVCNPTFKQNPGTMSTVSKSRSNIKNNIAAPLGVSSVSEKEFVLMPNPASDVVIIQMNKTIKDVRVELYDVTGRIVVTEKNYPAENKIGIGLNNLSSGIYTVSINCNGTKFIKKLAIEK